MRNALFLLLSISCFYSSFASHIRAADIYAERISAAQYKIVLTVYTDADRVNEIEELDEKTALLYFEKNADPTQSPAPIEVPRTAKEAVKSPNVFKNVFEYIYTPTGSGTFNISYIGVNRNYNIKNIGNENNSGDLNIYIELTVQHDVAIINNTPQLTIPPLDNANVDAIFTHNPGAFDPDGDILEFVLIEPRYVQETEVQTLAPESVPQYRDPDDPSFGDGSEFTLDAQTGQITWDTPLIEGEYNIAFLVREKRVLPSGDTLVLSEAVRDMQILVENEDNQPPVLIIPKDTCIAAGTTVGTGIADSLYAYDPDEGQKIAIIEGLGIFNERGQITPGSVRYREDTMIVDFTWNPFCSDVRETPYQLTFSAKDNHRVQLTTIENMFVTLIGDSPKNLTGTGNNIGVALTWDPYSCLSTDASMNIYRSECDSGYIERDPCTGGVPDEWGYELIGSVNIDQYNFTDSTAKKGAKYYYLIAAMFPPPAGGNSYASDLTSVELGTDLPTITNVDVLTTSTVSGETSIAWNHTFPFDSITYPGPYTYELYRSPDLNGNLFDTTPILTLNSTTLIDTSITDSKLNTDTIAYSYKLLMYNDGELLGESSSNSSVFLHAIGKGRRIELNWKSSVAWYYPDSLYQVIYIDSLLDGDFIKIDSVKGGTSSTVIDSLINGKNYCFYVETKGVFCNDTTGNIIISKSNIQCAVPQDSIPPCPPLVRLDKSECDNFESSETGIYTNTLRWEDKIAKECEKDIEKYLIYYRPNLETDFSLIDSIFRDNNTIEQKYEHEDLTSIAGCYYVIAKDEEKNTSGPSNEVCKDNCPKIEFPNVFTPNGDGKNDFFIPIPDPQFVESISFEVYNRWGNRVYESVSVEELSWDGKNEKGEELSEGVYYYMAIVNYQSLEKAENSAIFNGWIYLVK